MSDPVSDPVKPVRRQSWRVRLEAVLWEKLDEAPPRDAAPLARTLMELKGAATASKPNASSKPVRSALSEFEKRRESRKAAGS